MIKARVLAGEPAGPRRPGGPAAALRLSALSGLRRHRVPARHEADDRQGTAPARAWTPTSSSAPAASARSSSSARRFQLVRGGRDPELQVRPIRAGAGAAGRARPAAGRRRRQQLDAAYCFLRLVENRLQAYRDQQTHLLPGRRPGPAAPGALHGLRRLGGLRAGAGRAPAARPGAVRPGLRRAPGRRPDGQDPDLTALWRGTLDDARRPWSCWPPGAVSPTPRRRWQRLERLPRRQRPQGPEHPRARSGSTSCCRWRCQVIAASEAPDLALERVLRVLESVVRRTAYLAMLMERPMASSPNSRGSPA